MKSRIRYKNLEERFKDARRIVEKDGSAVISFKRENPTLIKKKINDFFLGYDTNDTKYSVYFVERPPYYHAHIYKNNKSKRRSRNIRLKNIIENGK